MNTAIAGLLGLVASVGFIFLKEMLNNTFKTDDDIQKHLGLYRAGRHSAGGSGGLIDGFQIDPHWEERKRSAHQRKLQIISKNAPFQYVRRIRPCAPTSISWLPATTIAGW